MLRAGGCFKKVVVKTGLTVRGKFSKLIESKVILRAAFLLDVFTEAKIFSLYTQKSDSNLIDIVGAAKSTKRHYVKLRKKMENNPEFVLTFPRLPSVICEVKKDNDTESWLYQDQMLKHLNQAKGYIHSHAVDIINKIIACFDQCFLSVHKQNDTGGVTITAEEGEKIIFNVYQILSCYV